MTQENDALEPNIETPSSGIGKLAAALTAIALIIAAMFWIFNVNATANDAKSLAQQDSQAIQQKADREDIKEIRQDIKEIRDFLMKGRERGER